LAVSEDFRKMVKGFSRLDAGTCERGKRGRLIRSAGRKTERFTSYQRSEPMKPTILCLATLISLPLASLAHAGGGCSKVRGRILSRIVSKRNVRSDQPTYRTTPQPAYQTTYRPSAAPQPAPQQYRTVASRPVMPPPNVLPIQASKARTNTQPVMSTVERLDVAKRDFRSGHHNSALAHASMLLQQMPNNANLLQFRSLVYFRKGDYKRSALDAYEAVKHGAIWSEATIEDLYAYPAFYERELRLLRLDESEDLTTAFLSAYHHLVAGDLDQGRDSLKLVLTIKPGDAVATALINLVDTRQGSKTTNQLAQAGR
jgi:hypothetical protein